MLAPLIRAVEEEGEKEREVSTTALKERVMASEDWPLTELSLWRRRLLQLTESQWQQLQQLGQGPATECIL